MCPIWYSAVRPGRGVWSPPCGGGGGGVSNRGAVL